MQEILKVTKLSKKYGNRYAVKNFSLNLSKGEIVGFIGPNGAGKSTTIKGILGYISLNSGNVKIFGEEVDSATISDVNDKIGFLPSDNIYLGNYTVKEFFKYSSELLGNKKFLAHALELAKELDLDIKKRIKYLSYGNQKKVGFIHSIMHKPELIVMDEPTAGLDPLIQKKIKDKILELAKEGAAIFLSSHNLTEVQEICSKVMMIKSGEIVIEDTTENLIKISNKIITLINPSKELKSKIQKEFKDITMIEMNTDLRLELHEYESMIKFLTENKFYQFFVERPNIENTFFDKYK